MQCRLEISSSVRTSVDDIKEFPVSVKWRMGLESLVTKEHDVED